MSLTGSLRAALYNLQNLKILQEIPLKPYLLTKPSVSTLQLPPHRLRYVNRLHDPPSPLNGGLINLQELCNLLRQRRKSDRGVSEDDCLRAISKLKVAGLRTCPAFLAETSFQAFPLLLTIKRYQLFAFYPPMFNFRHSCGFIARRFFLVHHIFGVVLDGDNYNCHYTAIVSASVAAFGATSALTSDDFSLAAALVASTGASSSSASGKLPFVASGIGNTSSTASTTSFGTEFSFASKASPLAILAATALAFVA
ncbi:hypothetical protein P8452_60297 [Trifolium repens]|nr:hypothetical protein P8452_60297 [Trifolium repens]